MTSSLTALSGFHPIVSEWFCQQFGQPSEVQIQAWPAIQSGQSTLIAAPTGSGKTLAAFLAVIDQLIKLGLDGELSDKTLVVYISPLKALSNDIRKNLEHPLNGIEFALLEACLPGVAIRAQTRTGDTTQAERSAMIKKPPHILVTTPESLYILLTSDSGRKMLSDVHTVIVDEIHALAGNKRGAHLMLSLARLNRLTHQPPTRIGLSATQKPLTEIAHYLIGSSKDACKIIDTGHVRERNLQIEVTGSPLEAVMANEVWEEIYDRLAELGQSHRTTLIFVNTRRLAERAAAALADRLGETAVTAHHGSLAKEHRLDAEQRLKQGQLQALVATASLELGIDIGDVDLVCQLGSPHGIAAFLQRVGRSGHKLNAIPKGRLFPLSRDDLLECTALLAAIQQDQMDKISIPVHPLDVLAQQVVAEISCGECNEAELYTIIRQAWPYRDLTEKQFSAVVKMLSDGYHTRRGRRGAYLHRDIIHGMLRPRKGARLTALLNGGAIPDQFDYDVILQPEGLFIGTLNEDFAFESLPGDIFQLGNSCYRMLKIEQGKVHVEDAHGQPPNLPFWFGEAPGRSIELSKAVSDLSGYLDQLLEQGAAAVRNYLLNNLKLPESAAVQLQEYVTAAKAALSVLPTFQKIVFERFFDETGDMHFVIHSPYGSRINRAWGLALRKRFCRRFNFELQAAAGEDNIVLSLGPTHSFPLTEPAGYLKSNSVKAVLIQALLTAPMFPTRWRWVANTALAVPRNRAGKKVPAPFQRNDAEDLIAVIFPDQLACFENIAGEREIPDHPLVEQTLWDCLHELMDIDGLQQLLIGIEQGSIEIIPRDLTTPSPMAQEIINARPYAFLDDAPAEERRTLAIQQRRFTRPEDAAEIGHLDPQAIIRVQNEAWPDAQSPDELHDSLLVLGFITAEEGQSQSNWSALMLELQQSRRAVILQTGEQILWVATERLHELRILFPEASHQPSVATLFDADNMDEQGIIEELLRSRMEGLGPITAAQLGAPLSLPVNKTEQALQSLQQQGTVIQGQFSPGCNALEWCERGLLARIHRYTLKQLRNEIKPVPPAVFMRFLFVWHGLTEPGEGESSLVKVLRQLEGVNLSATVWEQEILPKRLKPYFSSDLDSLCNAGQFVWLRLKPSGSNSPAAAGKTTSIALIERENLPNWRSFSSLPDKNALQLSSAAEKVYASLQQWGASFFQELQTETGLLKTQLEEALGQLVAAGLITADNFQGLRTLTLSQKVLQRRSKRYRIKDPLAAAGRWSLLRPQHHSDEQTGASIEHIARILLQRYGVVFRKILDKENGLPSWRELLYTFRRLEARGEIRGGRFVQGFAGEQYALPAAVSTLREINKQSQTEQFITISAADPLNLSGIITPGERIASKTGHRILYENGVPIAYSGKKDVFFLKDIDAEQQWAYKKTLMS
jgi:ATP-dependent helicase Lhr and Lhr-like helicase